MKVQLLKTIRVRNFKAIRDTGVLKLSPLTVFIGNNGSGKSSVLEALETFQSIVQDGVDEAMRPWHGFEHIWNKAVAHENREKARDKCAHQTNPMFFSFSGWSPENPVGGNYRAEMAVTLAPGGNKLFIQHEEVRLASKLHIIRNDHGRITNLFAKEIPFNEKYSDGESSLRRLAPGVWGQWQFLSLVPQNMSEPIPQKRTGGPIMLAKDGRNIAEYLRWIREADLAAFNGILESLQFVLSYATDMQITLTSELERTVYLQMTEKNFKVPSWLFSTGTLRVLALLAVLRSPSPPPLIVIEEIENGLDPRTVNLILEEIRGAVDSGRTQVIATTHSPYLLDLLDLSHLVLCERVKGEPVFVRPQDRKGLRDWAKSFAPGQLYIMDRMHVEGR